MSVHQDWIGNQIAQTGRFYEHDLLSALHSMFPAGVNGAQLIDVGANVGNHSVFFSQVLKADVVAFEPNPLNFARLEANALRYGFIAEQRLIGNGGTWQAMPYSPNNMGAIEYARKEGEESFSGTGAFRLDDLKLKPFLIKIDVEGMELEVITGASDTIEKMRPIIIYECLEDKLRAPIEEFMVVHSYSVRPLYHVNGKLAIYLAVPCENIKGGTK